MDEQRIIDALGTDFAAGTEAFRDALLARCLEVLGSGSDCGAADAAGTGADTDAAADVLDLRDADMEMLSAAGDVSAAGEVAPADAETGVTRV